MLRFKTTASSKNQYNNLTRQTRHTNRQDAVKQLWLALVLTSASQARVPETDAESEHAAAAYFNPSLRVLHRAKRSALFTESGPADENNWNSLERPLRRLRMQ